MAKDVRQTLRALEQLLNLFRFERAVYLSVTLIAVIVLLITFVATLLKQDWATAVGMFGSGGVIAFTSSRLLTMWDQAFKLVERALEAETDG